MENTLIYHAASNIFNMKMIRAVKRLSYKFLIRVFEKFDYHNCTYKLISFS